MHKTFLLPAFLVSIICAAVMLEGCTLDYPESTEATPVELTSNVVNNIIQNGHINDTYEEDKLCTPCSFTYAEFGMVIETEFTNDISGFSADEIDCRYLVVHTRQINTSGRSVSVSADSFVVYADGELCEQIGNEDYYLLPERETDIDLYYKVPDECSEIIIEHSRITYPTSVLIYVQDNGLFTEEDIRSITNRFDITNYDSTNEYIVPIDSAESDSFYHSSNSNTDYTIDLTYDNDPLTCWQDGSEGDAIGESLHYYFVASEINSVNILNGNRSRSESYMNNNRLETALLSFYCNGENVYEMNVVFEDEEEITPTTISLEQSIYCDSVELTIQDVYNGASYSETCVAEVSIVSDRYSVIGCAVYSSIQGPYLLESNDVVDDAETDTVISESIERESSSVSPSVVCEYAYVARHRNTNIEYEDQLDYDSLNFDVYYLFDVDTHSVYVFQSTDLGFITVGTYSGTITGNGGWGIEANCDDGEWMYINGDSECIYVTDDIGFACYAERIDSASIESQISLPQ